ncbi:MAG: imidazole glycerol phosphate synthase subunit HisH [Acidimicrobiia bacterium]
MKLAIVPTGTANTASVMAALRRQGAEPCLVARPEEVEAAGQVVLPGVGTFGAAMAELDRLQLRQALASRVAEGRPTLAVCVGMQLLGADSEESPGVAGLGVIPGGVSAFPDDVIVPQLGWNRVEPEAACRFLEPGWAYFANSYRFVSPPQGWTAATTQYGGSFVSALERGDVLACQFHPELSGEWGAKLLDRWLSATGGGD